MKVTKFTNLLVLAVVLTLTASGCRKRPGYVTNIPQGKTENPIDLSPAPALSGTDSGTNNSANTSGFPQSDPSLRQNWPRDAKFFEADTAHFDFDSSVVKSADKPKVAKVAEHLKANPSHAVEVDGHCDERGTEEYNRSLGERRALALREELISLGIDPGRIDTVSYGKDRPADTGHDESAWKKNRRGEFLLETPPGTTP
ncbi:MAG TPA: OmpA family protein [Candidatus Acidoferrum sp.]|jgi:peptidoglycan-associated lipoprotein|nr:OmpA family protein [Candidatus Acidoferrum sp.]